jgi:hypothetical protein
MNRSSEVELGLPDRHGRLLSSLTAEASQALARQSLVVEQQTWLQNGAADAFVFSVLARLYDRDEPWDRRTIMGEPAVSALRITNATVHSLKRTAGAVKWKPMVAEAQRGMFCATCGSREDLQVDHIVPVSRGGEENEIHNMQLLCGSCNSAKRNLDGELLPSVFLTVVSDTVSPRLRYKRIQLEAIQEGPRRIGVCECGHTARDTLLRVRPISRMAANLLNLRIVCDLCESDQA